MAAEDFFNNYSKQGRTKRRGRAGIVTGVIGVLFGIYFFFFMDLIVINNCHAENAEISDEKILAECPGISVTDEETAWLDRICSAAEEYKEKNAPPPLDDRYGVAKRYVFRADDWGLEHFTEREDENYSVTVYDYGDSGYSLYAYFDAEHSGIFVYKEQLEKSKSAYQGATHYHKEINVTTFWGRKICTYKCIEKPEGEKLGKTEYSYGLLAMIRNIIDGMMSV